MAVSISRSEKIFNGCNVTFMIFLSAWFIVPFVVVASTSVVGAAEAARRGGLVLIPETFDLSAYQAIFAKGSAIIRSYGVTLFRVVVGTALNLLFTAPFAYALSKRSVPGRTPITHVRVFHHSLQRRPDSHLPGGALHRPVQHPVGAGDPAARESVVDADHAQFLLHHPGEPGGVGR